MKTGRRFHVPAWTVEQAFLLRLFRYIPTGWIFDLPRIHRVECDDLTVFQCACDGRQLRTLGDDGDIIHKFHLSHYPHSVYYWSISQSLRYWKNKVRDPELPWGSLYHFVVKVPQDTREIRSIHIPGRGCCLPWWLAKKSRDEQPAEKNISCGFSCSHVQSQTADWVATATDVVEEVMVVKKRIKCQKCRLVQTQVVPDLQKRTFSGVVCSMKLKILNHQCTDTLLILD